MNDRNEKVDEFFKNLKFETLDDVENNLNELMKILFEEEDEIDNFNEMIRKTTDDFQFIKGISKSYDLLNEAVKEPDKKKAMKLAKKAYDNNNACFDALLFQIQLEEDTIKKYHLLEEGLKKEKERLQETGITLQHISNDSNELLEIRPYLMGLYTKANIYVEEGKLKKAIEVCKEVLEITQSDRIQIRYLLLAIYSYLEDENEVMNLYKKYKEENLYTLIPVLILYYKLENKKKVKEYLQKIENKNHHFIKYFKNTLKIEKGNKEGYPIEGKPSEIINYFNSFSFLLNSVPNLKYDLFDLKNEETKKIKES